MGKGEKPNSPLLTEKCGEGINTCRTDGGRIVTRKGERWELKKRSSIL